MEIQHITSIMTFYLEIVVTVLSLKATSSVRLQAPPEITQCSLEAKCLECNGRYCSCPASTLALHLLSLYSCSSFLEKPLFFVLCRNLSFLIHLIGHSYRTHHLTPRNSQGFGLLMHINTYWYLEADAVYILGSLGGRVQGACGGYSLSRFRLLLAHFIALRSTQEMVLLQGSDQMSMASDVFFIFFRHE